MSDELTTYLVVWPMRCLLVIFIFIGIRRYYLGFSSRGWPVAKGIIVHSKSDYYVNPSAGNGYIPDIEFTYTVNGTKYKSQSLNFSLNQGAGNRENSEYYTKKFRAGRKVDVRYNPNKPGQAVLEPGISNIHFAITMCLGIVCIGGMGFANYIF